MFLNQNDALRLRYDKPIDRIAASLLYKAPWWAFAPEPIRRELKQFPPRVLPEDLVDICHCPPTGIKNHRFQHVGAYLVLGYAGFRLGSGGWVTNRYGTRKLRHRRKLHRWWCVAPDGTVEVHQWERLRLLLADETLHDLYLREQLRKTLAVSK
jgi:hypothetical protein